MKTRVEKGCAESKTTLKASKTGYPPTALSNATNEPVGVFEEVKGGGGEIGLRKQLINQSIQADPACWLPLRP